MYWRTGKLMAFIVLDKTFAANGKIRYNSSEKRTRRPRRHAKRLSSLACAIHSSLISLAARRSQARRRFDCETLKATALFGRKADRADGRAN